MSRVFSLGTGAVLSVLIARSLGPEGQGLYSLCVNTALVVSLFVNCGLGLSAVYFLGKRIFSPGEIASVSLGFGAVGGVAAFAAASFVLLFFRIPGLSHVPFRALILALVAVPFLNLSEYYFYFLIGSDRIKQFNIVTAARNALQLLLVVLVLVAVGLTLFGAVGSWVASFAAVAAAAMVFVRRIAPFGFSLRGALVRASVSFGLKGYLSRVASFLYYRIDMFILSYFMGAGAVGHYAIAVLLAELLWNVPSSLAPGVMYKSASEDSQDRDRLTAAACRHTVLICLLAGLGIVVLGKSFIRVAFGVEYLPSVTPLILLLPGTAVLSVGSVLANDFVGRGKQLMNSFAAVVTLLINVPLNFILIPRWGVAGAAVASSVSYSIGVIVMLVEFTRITGIGPAGVLLPRPRDLSAYVRLLSGILRGRQKG